MNALVPIVMYGWLPLSLALFMFLRPRHAVLAVMVGGWLFLPQATFELPRIPDYTRFAAVSVPALLGVMLFDFRRLSSVSLRWFDLPIVIWCLCPLATSVANGLGVYNGIAGIGEQILNYGIPYVLGRVYFCDREGSRDLAMAIFIGGLIYIPFILYELRMSPQLHNILYGYHPDSFQKVWRWGGYRPWVFMSHGIELGLWMAMASIAGVWLWWTGAVRRLWGIGLGWLTPPVFAVFLACKAANGWGVAVLGLSVLFGARWFGTRLLLLGMLLMPPVYVLARAQLGYEANALIATLEQVNPARAKSLLSRVAHEQILMDRAEQRPLFGWGTYGRNRAEGELPEEAMGTRSTTDSMWIIAYGQRGLVGLLSLGAVLLVPPAMLLRRLGAAQWAGPRHAPAAVLAVMLMGFAIDGLYTAKPNPVYIVVAGAVGAYAAFAVNRRPVTQPAPERSREAWPAGAG